MKYNFDEVVNRRGTDSLKWDVLDHELPMWVADMDFQTAPEIREAFTNRISHGVFGYANVTDEWYDAYISWWKKRHHLEIAKESLIFCTGIVPAISSIVRKLTTPNENVVILTPVYNIFFNSIVNNGARVLESALIYNDGTYDINWEDLEEKLSNPQTSLMIFCNPHNPVGKIWDVETLKRVGELCERYGVTVISDEIHCDIVRPDFEYVPFASVSKTCANVSITCIAPTKCFNLAGLQSAAVMIPNPFLRHKVWRGLNTDEVAEPNSFACLAAVTAFGKGEEWLKEMNQYVFENRDIVAEFIEQNIPGIKLVKGNATYLLWLDIEGLGYDSEKVSELIRENTGLYLTAGSEYGAAGKYFLRMNVACPRAVLLDGLQRLKTGCEKIK